MAGKGPIVATLLLGLVLLGGIALGGLYVYLSRRPLSMGGVTVPAWLTMLTVAALMAGALLTLILYEETMAEDDDPESPGPFEGVSTLSKRRLRKLLDTLERARPYLERPRELEQEEDEAFYEIQFSGPSFPREIVFSLRSDLRDDDRRFRRFVDTMEDLCRGVTDVTE